MSPPNRFDKLHYEIDTELDPSEEPAPETQFYRDPTRTIINTNDSPDVGFEKSVNPYRGCEHGCVYCFARPTHEYLGFSSGLDFETKIMVKEDAPELLRAELSSAKWKPQVVVMSGVTDPYQPIERKLQLTRRCLQVLAEFRNPVAIITKGALVSRDVDILGEMASYGAAAVYLSITTLDPNLANILEPRASTPQLRLDAIETLSRAGVITGVMTAPIIPAINEHEIPAILSAAAAAGARSAGYTVVRLPWGIAPMFEAWLEEHFPDRKEKVLHKIMDIRGGRLNDPRWGSRLKGEGNYSKQIEALFTVACRKSGLNRKSTDLSVLGFRPPAGPQLALF